MQNQPRSKEESFHEAVARLRREGRIPRVWSRHDLYGHLEGRFSHNTINSLVSNYAVSADGSQVGDYVRKGTQARFVRVDRGRYVLATEADAPPIGDSLQAHAVVVQLDADAFERGRRKAAESGQSLEALLTAAMQVYLRGLDRPTSPLVLPTYGRAEELVDLDPQRVHALELADDLDSLAKTEN